MVNKFALQSQGSMCNSIVWHLRQISFLIALSWKWVDGNSVQVSTKLRNSEIQTANLATLYIKMIQLRIMLRAHMLGNYPATDTII